MKNFSLVLLMTLIFFLPGYGIKQNINIGNGTISSETVYYSDTSVEDCYLCGDNADNPISSYWGQSNIALISLNTFKIWPIEINRYDSLGRLVEKYTGAASFGSIASIDGSFSTNLMVDYDRGYATGTVNFLNDRSLDTRKAASFLCADCLNEILPQRVSQCFGVGVINFETKEIRLFEEHLISFGLGDFYIDCDLKEDQNNDSRQMHLLVFYCPIRYETEPYTRIP